MTTQPTTEPTTRSRLSLRDRWARERYLARFDWEIEGYPRPGRLRRELRAELDATAAEIGMRQALAGLGSPRILARRYVAELGDDAPRWRFGALYGSLAVIGLTAVLLAYALGTIDTLTDLGGGTVTRTFLGGTTTYTSTDDDLSVRSWLTWQQAALYVVVFLVPYLVGARAWRAWRRPRPAGVV